MRIAPVRQTRRRSGWVLQFTSIWLGLLVSGSAFADSARLAREDIEWCRIWVPGIHDPNKPKVLLIGDSITEAYSSVVEEQLKEIADVARLTTSKCLGDPALLQEIRLVLANAHFQVIHFNNGMHGAAYSEAEYKRDLPALYKILAREAPGTRLIFATTTPKRTAHHLDQWDPFTERIRVRNATLADFARKHHIPVDDLFGTVEPHAEYFSQDGTHFVTDGVRAEGLQVAQAVKAQLGK